MAEYSLISQSVSPLTHGWVGAWAHRVLQFPFPYTFSQAGTARGQQRSRFYFGSVRLPLPLARTLLCMMALFSGSRCALAQEAPAVVVTTAILESALRDAVGPSSAKLRVVRLLQPGGCPGHFDLSPRMVPLLRDAHCLIRHDYQAGLDQKIVAVGGADLDILAVPETGSLLIPEHYAELVLTMQRLLLARGLIPEGAGQAHEVLRNDLVHRLDDLKGLAADHRRRYQGRRVIASEHQKTLCEWLGYDVTGILRRPENTRPADLQSLADADAGLVVANLQSDVNSGKTVAARKGIPLVVISNFPDAKGYGQGYAELFRENIRRLADGWQGDR